MAGVITYPTFKSFESTGDSMAKKQTAKPTSFFEEEEDFLDNIENALEEQEDVIDEVPDDEYEPLVPEPEEPKRAGRPMIVREVKVDTHTVQRKRVALTRSMCRRQGCNFDAAVAAGYDEYKRVHPSRRQEVMDLLDQHMILKHSESQGHIVFESDLQQQWFGVDEQTGKPRRPPRRV